MISGGRRGRGRRMVKLQVETGAGDKRKLSRENNNLNFHPGLQQSGCDELAELGVRFRHKYNILSSPPPVRFLSISILSVFAWAWGEYDNIDMKYVLLPVIEPPTSTSPPP